MKLFARLISHVFALALVTFLALGFIYRGELFPELGLSGTAVHESVVDGSTASSELPAPVIREAMTAPAVSEADQDAAVLLPIRPAADQGASVLKKKAAAAEIAAAPAVNPADADASAANKPVIESDALAGEAGVKRPLETERSLSLAKKGIAPVDASDAMSPAKVPSANAAMDSAVSLQRPGDAAGKPPVSVPVRTTAKVNDVAKAPVLGRSKDTNNPTGGLVVASPGISGNSAEAVVMAVPATVAEKPEVSAEPTESPGADEKKPVSSAALSSTMLGLAREAYWLHDFDAAEHYYRRVISIDPENPDGHGELANLYLSRGDRKLAAQGYYEAGLRLARRGMTVPAIQLVEILRWLDSPQADALVQEIEASRGVPD